MEMRGFQQPHATGVMAAILWELKGGYWWLHNPINENYGVGYKSNQQWKSAVAFKCTLNSEVVSDICILKAR